MENNSETFRSGVHQEFLGSPVSRRTLLKSIPAITLAPAPWGIAPASADSADASSQKNAGCRSIRNLFCSPSITIRYRDACGS